MQSWKFNSIAQAVLRVHIMRSLNIAYTDVYKTIKDVYLPSGIIETKDGKKYKLVLEEI
jgi:hypothetical protein